MSAVCIGTSSIIRLLLSAGAHPDNGCPPPIVVSIAKEDTASFRLLREYGARLDTPETGAWAMAVAQACGLKSMEEMLAREGVDRGAILMRCPIRWEYCLFPNQAMIENGLPPKPR